MTTTNRGWRLARRPTEAASGDELEFFEAAVPEIGDGQLLVRNLYLSLDPTNRVWMSDREQYLPPVRLGETMRGATVGIVERTRSPRFKVGDYVAVGNGGWQEFVALSAQDVGRIRPIEGIPLTAHLSVLGATGLTAYFGLLDICRPKADEVIAISAAAGAVGSVAGQIAKIKGCQVLGIAGGAEKCAWLGDLGFDAAIDYRSEDIAAALDRHAPDGIDMCFENVGGPAMEAVYARLRLNGRMALCGLISTYNVAGPVPGPGDFSRILMQRLTIKGFIVLDYLDQARLALGELAEWIADGRIKWKDHVIDGLEAAPATLDLLFSGRNQGKLIIGISDPR